jgi:hypothetical protein
MLHFLAAFKNTQVFYKQTFQYFVLGSLDKLKKLPEEKSGNVIHQAQKRGKRVTFTNKGIEFLPRLSLRTFPYKPHNDLVCCLHFIDEKTEDKKMYRTLFFLKIKWYVPELYLYPYPALFFLLVVLGFEFRTSRFVGRHSPLEPCASLYVQHS